MPAATVRRLNWACGPKPAPGWINSDRIAAPGIEVSCDVRSGLPVPDGYFDYAVSIHGLQDLAYLDVVPALRELRRVLRPGGVLRLALPDLDRAIEHINRYGSKHTDAIVTRNLEHAQAFVQRVDTANAFVNCSTRFSDGEQYGLGAEIGISTDKLHARGPMGADDLTTYKWIAWGDGQLRT